MATTVFESPTAVGAKVFTITTTVTNTSGAYTSTINDERVTAAMKAIKLELGTPSVFDDIITVVCNNGSMTISCNSVSGTSTVAVSIIKACEDPTEVTSAEFDVLANRIGNLTNLTTTEKTTIVGALNEVGYTTSTKQDASDNSLSTTAKTVVGAINENSTAIAKVQNGLAYIVGDTNTTGGTLAVGQFVYVKGHSTIDEGLRKVTASISANGNITTSNTAACSEGGLNALNSNITGYVSDTTGKYWRFQDGTQICAKHVTGSVSITTAWGSLYYGSLSLGAWPIQFYTTPTLSVTNVTDSGGLLSTVSSFDGAQAGSIDIIRPGSGTYTISVDIIAIGRWKA